MRFGKLIPSPLLVAVLAAAAPLAAAPQDSPAARAAQCHEWHDCRQLALDALAREDYERFHDLAWRAVQTGPPRDPALMFLLARAQSLSGRAHDALVMLGRLADMGVATDVIGSDEFRVVRTLREWPALEARLRALDTSRVAKPEVSASKTETASTPETSSTAIPVKPPDLAAPPPVPPSLRSTPEEAARSAAAETPSPSPLYHAEEAVRVPGVSFTPHGLAYDAVSSRFVVADPADRKLVIFDERSSHAVDLVRAASAGFSEIAAFEIDARRGDLWLLSDDTAAVADQPSSISLHKLQLVSGRQIANFTLPSEFAEAQVCDIAVTPDGAVLMLDGHDRRIISFEPATGRFVTIATLEVDGLASLAASDDHFAYVAHAAGIARVDLATGRSQPVQADEETTLSGFARIRWAKGALVGIQRHSDGRLALMRARTSRRGVKIDEISEPAVTIADPSAVTFSGSDLYVLTRGTSSSGASAEIVVERFHLK